MTWLPHPDQFWSKVNKQGPDDCWLWIGARHAEGYGYMARRSDGGQQQQLAHRIALRLEGHDLEGLCALHVCDNPPCVNPRHLYVGTPADNARDREGRGRGDHVVGSAHGRAKITEADAIAIRQAYAAGVGSRQLADQYGLTQNYIGEIVRGDRWKHVCS